MNTEDIKVILEKIAAVGYKEIESAFSSKPNFYGYNPTEFKKIVEDLGMKWIAHHVGGASYRGRPPGATPPQNATPAGAAGSPRPQMLNLRYNYQQVVDNAIEGGLKYVVCASTPIGTMDDIKASIETFNKTGEACKKAGIEFVYHNYATEFAAVEGTTQTPYELIMAGTDKDLVKMELDMAWASKGGKDPIALFKEHPKRFPLWHIKDISADFKTITEVGNGSVDFKRVFKEAKLAGMKHFFVEQDMVASFDSVQTSFTNLSKMI